MANLPSQHPHLSLHLSDRSLTPLITSSRTQPQLGALTSLTHAALSAHESALRLGLGVPQRVMVEHGAGGPVLLHSYLRADTTTTTAATNPHPPPSSSSANTPAAATNGQQTPTPTASASDGGAEEPDSVERRLQALQLQGSSSVLDSAGALTPTHDAGAGSNEEDANAPPMLVGVVVAPNADEAREARRAAARLERVGREVQMRWAEAQQQTHVHTQTQTQTQEDRGRVAAAGD
ncbi:hypothetical protein F4819DRAFT_485069 [Hypoxylon fuscum]|nr:hypothetical protein F4819DRAFT_485069 [Hypoxylon fuscum]